MADALLHAGLRRMRPIVMTTTAIVFGMLPLALALNERGEIQAPMGRAILGGVITSTLLTLVVVPVLYTYLDNFPRWLKRRFGAAQLFEMPQVATASENSANTPPQNQ